MSQFFEDLFQSIFTPGPTPTLLIATNAAFAGLQLVFFVLLIATYSVHFFILSFLCGGLWVAINWFAREIQAAKDIDDQKHEKKRTLKREGIGSADDSGTETEDAATSGGAEVVKSATLESSEGNLRRRSLAGSGTDSEWDKVESEISAEE